MKLKLRHALFLLPLFSLQINGQEIKAELNKEIKRTEKISYILDYPQKVKGNLPLIVFLHGSGERGTDLEMVKAHSPFTYKNLIKEPVAILAPQCPADSWWDTITVYNLIKEIQKKYKIDASRIYLTGLSLGGWGTLKLAMEHPEMFAAVVPVCAPTDQIMTANVNRYKDLNMKIFHGGMDDIVLPENAFRLYQKLHPVNPGAELIIFPNDNHNSWDSAYSDPGLYEWMLSKKK
ncbi:prolyl oligopeptidase family serine peptidase [Chryseobacterium sp. PTM-20240506]|uniref:carboxylesterase family protein n=1 Tax=unclassified Chryseobacterium TaxID=2593645 RepID=UPI0023595EDA|nr:MULTISPECIES: prolyl oligopeptidase family serine peptidase [unclassified Chryseobacterium]MDC8104448.1 prolyl oligopeptidase family serine peptidase [Chryseobacterium sp. B21-037]MDQ1804062.1 prolyl oligopeptidase family serine peptidase [Chryseobacterium sp. CKR4-1]